MASDAALSLRLTGIRLAAEDALLFEFAVLNAKLPPVEPGAHIDLHLPVGPRQYSLVTPLCSSQTLAIAVGRQAAGRGGSLWLHDNARVGAAFSAGMPRNHFALRDDTGPVLLLAGGIGITPIYPMFRALIERGRNVHLHYWAKSPAHALFLEQLQNDPHVTLHYPETRATVAAVIRAAPGAVYCCGPERMLRECAEHAPDPERLYTERFSTAAPPELAADDAGFTVRLARDGREFSIAPGETILGRLLEAGLDIPYSCEEGVCGACETMVLEGTPAHRDAVRRPEDNDRLGRMMICCSASRSALLVLDI